MSEQKIILSQVGTGGRTIQVKNISLELIDLMFTGWDPCGKYVTTGKAKNTNPVARYLDTWMLLKALTTSGNIHNYRSKTEELSRLCKISARTLHYRLRWLKANNLVRTAGKNLYLSSYKALETQFEIDTTERLKIPVNYDTSTNTRLADQLYVLGHKRWQDRCNYMYNKKLNQEVTIRRDIEDHAIAYEANPEKLEQDSEYFRQSHDVLLVKSYKEEAVGLTTFKLVHKQCDANPDLNLTQASIGRNNGFSVNKKQDEVTKKDMSSCSGLGHLHKRLAAKGLITIKERHIVSDYCAHKDEKIFHHRFVHGTRQTIWFRPNHITINYKAIFNPQKATSAA